jgi:DNA primase
VDNNIQLRTLSFEVVASALGIDLGKFKRSKDEWVGPCPIHQSKNNQGCFRYSDTGVYHCFSCRAKGRGSIDICKAIRNVGFQAAVDFLTPLATLPQSQQKSPAGGHSNGGVEGRVGDTDSSISDAHSRYQKIPATDSKSSTSLVPLIAQYHKFKIASPWLEARVPDAGIRERYGVFCYDNPKRKSAFSGRVMLPVKDVEGTLFGYLGRYIPRTGPSGQVQEEKDIPKYLFPAKLPKLKFLFGAYELWEGRPHRKVYLVEGPFSVMRLAMLGVPAVAAYGWSVSAEQIEILASLAKGVYYLPDRNKAGPESAGVVQALAKRLWVRAPELPTGVDDAEYLTKTQLEAL